MSFIIYCRNPAEESDAFERLQVEYNYTDHLTLAGGMIFYQSGDQAGFSDIGDSDRLFIEFKYSC
ncbi:hypothetical protein DGMP_32380 [Desulfomarina profundi]|uniref:Uncharacterized protein n=1 Tax=Desulfomarina profundi TaxID=2772557 RepID=A0A8D5FKG7_9BACT|nr:hypothetical protein [Desulfomarina profundi]BCL62545.1 hypothetical protein DGMP_32380 [Desulfomarina profundi]